jgi:hypothetical protein
MFQTIMLTLPVSSSSVTKITPNAVPDRYRQLTIPGGRRPVHYAGSAVAMRKASVAATLLLSGERFHVKPPKAQRPLIPGHERSG